MTVAYGRGCKSTCVTNRHNLDYIIIGWQTDIPLGVYPFTWTKTLKRSTPSATKSVHVGTPMASHVHTIHACNALVICADKAKWCVQPWEVLTGCHPVYTTSGGASDDPWTDTVAGRRPYVITSLGMPPVYSWPLVTIRTPWKLPLVVRPTPHQGSLRTTHGPLSVPPQRGFTTTRLTSLVWSRVYDESTS